MRYPVMRGTATRRMRIPQFSGGLNHGVPAQMIDDEQISECRNVWFKNGAIRTRDGLHTSDEFIVEHSTIPESIVALHGTKGGMTAIRTTNEILLLDEQGKRISFRYASEGCRTAFFVEYGSNDRIPGADGDGLLLYESTGRVYKVDLSTREVSEITDELMYAPLYFVNGRSVDMYGDTCEGTTYEGFNLLTNRFRAQFTTRETDGGIYTPPVLLADGSTATAVYTGSDGTAYTFTLTVDYGQRICASAGQTVSVREQDLTLHLVYSPYFNSFRFGTLAGEGDYEKVLLPFVGFSNNLEFTLERKAERDSSVFDMSVSEWFGGVRSGVMNGTRLFLAGSSSEPNLVRYSDVNNPLYFPENNFMYVGSSEQAVTALAKQSGVLVIFKERETYFCEYAYSSADAESIADGSAVDVTGDAYFPLTQLTAGIGCDLPDTVVLCANRLVWATSEGDVYTITSLSNLTERSVRPISYQVREDLRRLDLSNASAALYDGWYTLLVGGNVLYMLDTSSYGFVYFTSYYNDQKASSKIVWFRWEAPFTVVDSANGNKATSGKGQRIFRTGAGAAILALSDYWRVYEIAGNADTVVTTHGAGRRYDLCPIEASFTSKLYDLGSEERKKHVHTLFVSIAGTEGSAVAVTYLTDHGEERDQKALLCRPVAGAYNTERFTDMALSPHSMRARYFGVRFETTAPVAIGGMVILYKIVGEVR